ncbi:hypothetical protein [Goodfellowiella coeruleoviolacea]|uniref:Transposase n=1 Tax=Goodfellowiella coeruleoviolacea TaxID=334858 RepID=A0AAE3G855_9PSEU|nr:hypothetical protein [Goodfellowiella coeruleoviolacea]MCP2163471.1 hypothetical protein [Goodfellowiella coeruleoviolacea]
MTIEPATDDDARPAPGATPESTPESTPRADSPAAATSANGGDVVPAAALTDDERAELAWLRTENNLLRVERDILLRVATGYAKDMDHLLRRSAPRSAP